MHRTTAALNPTERAHSRYLDALIAFRPETCLRMEGEGDAGGTGDGGGAGGQGGGAAAPEMATGPDGKSLGYPKDTPVAEMTDEQKTAYHVAKDRERKAATQAWKTVTGDRTPEQLKADLEELESLRTAKLTPSEQALAEATKKGREEGLATERQSTAKAIFEGALSANGVEGDDLDELVANFNVAGYIGDNGVDVARIQTFAKRFTPSDKGSTRQQRRDFGGGSRREGATAPGSAGRAQAVKRGFIKDDSKSSTTS